jgi:hypothetical protein
MRLGIGVERTWIPARVTARGPRPGGLLVGFGFVRRSAVRFTIMTALVEDGLSYSDSSSVNSESAIVGD